MITDHSSLRWLHNLKNSTGRLARWSLSLTEYDFDILHIKGSSHHVPDALSRMFESVTPEEILLVKDSVPSWYNRRFQAVSAFPERFPTWKVVDNKLYHYRPNPLVTDFVDDLVDWKLVPTDLERESVLIEAHDNPQCTTCQMRKVEQKIPAGLMGHRVVEEPWTVVPADEEILERLRRKYDRDPRHTIHQKDEVTSTGGLHRSSDTGVQTDQTNGCICRCHIATHSRPKTPSKPSPPTSPGPTSTEPHFRPPTPVRPSSSRHTSADPYPKRSPTPSPSKQIPSLLNFKIPFPDSINRQTMEFLRATSEFRCWNCSEATHRYLQCPHPRQVFCLSADEKESLRSPAPSAATTLFSFLFFTLFAPFLFPFFFRFLVFFSFFDTNCNFSFQFLTK